MKKINLKYILFALLLSVKITAQQNPQFTHYMYNMSVINPAYSTDDAYTLNTGALYRTQWVGAVGAPKTATLFAHTPVAKKIEMGISFVNDAIGDIVKENNAFVDFAYVLPISKNNKWSFGIKAGASLFTADIVGLKLSDVQADIAFSENINKVFPNVGVGTYFFGKKYYLGFSAPNLLTTKHLKNKDGIQSIGVENVHYFFTGGYVFDMNNNIKLKPAFMTKAVEGAPISIDLTANVLYKKLIELGAGYRFDDSVSALAGFYVNPNLKIGYSYDYTLSNLGKYNSGTHEIFILFDIGLSKMISNRGYDKSPRFF